MRRVGWQGGADAFGGEQLAGNGAWTAKLRSSTRTDQHPLTRIDQHRVTRPDQNRL